MGLAATVQEQAGHKLAAPPISKSLQSANLLRFISLKTAVQTESVNTWEARFFPGCKKGTKAGEYGCQLIQMKIE